MDGTVGLLAVFTVDLPVRRAARAPSQVPTICERMRVHADTRSRWTGAAGRGAPLASMERCKRAVARRPRLGAGQGHACSPRAGRPGKPGTEMLLPPVDHTAACRALCMLVRWALIPYLSYGIPVTALKPVNVFNRLPRILASNELVSALPAFSDVLLYKDSQDERGRHIHVLRVGMRACCPFCLLVFAVTCRW